MAGRKQTASKTKAATAAKSDRSPHEMPEGSATSEPMFDVSVTGMNDVHQVNAADETAAARKIAKNLGVDVSLVTVTKRK